MSHQNEQARLAVMNEKDDVYIALNGRSEKSSLLEVAAKNSALLHLNYSRQFPVINRWKRALKWLKDLPKTGRH